MTSSKKPYFPMFFDISEKKVIIVGAGTIAKRRIRTLIDFTNHLTVIAPEVNKELLSLQEQGLLSIHKKKYQPEDLCGADLVIAATNDHQTNEDIYRVCKHMGIPVNVCSDKHKCDFYFPAIAKKDQLVAGISSSGSNSKQAKELTRQVNLLLADFSD